MAADQKTQRIDPASTTGPSANPSNNRFNNAIFDDVRDEKHYVETDGLRYPKVPIKIFYTETFYLKQYEDLIMFCKLFVGEQLLFPVITKDRMKTYYTKQINDLGFQIGLVTAKKIQRFEKYVDAPTHINLYVILIKHREIRMISDGNEINGVEIIQITILNLKDFMEKDEPKDETFTNNEFEKV